jgi:2-polyprenyl-6-methoxyphenol hydroxylase-like FAD-dependent oxidoreductase
VKVLICGGGIAGLSLAWCLHRRGHAPVVVERSPGPRAEGYMIDFFGSGYDAAERLGLLPDLERIHYPVRHLVFADGHGRARLTLPYSVLRRRLFGGRHFNFLRGDLEAVLYARVKDRVPMHFGTTVESFEQTPGRVQVSLSDGSQHDVDVLVGADGVHSHVRQLTFGGGAGCERLLGCRAAAFVLDAVPAGLASLDDFITLNVPGRQVAVYPIRAGRLATFFLHRTARRGGAEATSPETGRAELRAVYGDLGWIVPELLDRCPADGGLYFDSVSQVELPDWRKGRVTLAGDACQCVSLLAGQGASLAVAGAFILAEELDRSSDDIVETLARYEGYLKPEIAKKQAAGRRIAEWFLPATPARLALRNLMLRASIWPFVAPLFRRGLAAEGLLTPDARAEPASA